MSKQTSTILLIAEIGSTHDGSAGIARNSIAVAASCGATAVKFQTHIPQFETTRDAPAPPFFKHEPRFEYFQRTGFSRDVWRQLVESAHEVGIALISSPFSIEAVAILEEAGIDQYKVASGEVTNLPLLRAIASTGKPVILSSGMSPWSELDAAVEALAAARGRLSLLQCTSMYPCPYDRVGLNVITEMRARYGLPIGLSDHTTTNYASFAAAALGANVIEKHFTLSRHLYGSDAANSIEPTEFRDLAEGIRAIEAMRAATVDKDRIDELNDMRRIFQKSLVAAVDIPKGALIAASMLAIKKPGTGLAPARLSEIVGRRTRRPIAADTVLTDADLEV